MVCSPRLVVTPILSLVAITLFAQCGLSGDVDDEGEPTGVHFDLNGHPFEVSPALTVSLIDYTKNVGGPNTHLWLVAAQESTAPDRLFGNRLYINVPAIFTPGEHPVGFSYIAGRKNIWLAYYEDQTPGERWIAHSGTYVIDEIGGVGERYRAHFDEIRLSTLCGDEKVLTNGTIDVRIGSESTYPASEVDLLGEIPESLQQIESSVFFTVDGQSRICPSVDLALMTLPPGESNTGRSEDILAVTGSCPCGFEADGSAIDDATMMIDLPPAGHGSVAAPLPPYSLYWTEDLYDTPFYPADDEIYVLPADMELEYRQVGAALDESVSISLLGPVELVFLDTNTLELDYSRTRSISGLSIEGVLFADCRPGSCY